jgi:hypothetical protein
MKPCPRRLYVGWRHRHDVVDMHSQDFTVVVDPANLSMKLRSPADTHRRPRLLPITNPVFVWFEVAVDVARINALVLHLGVNPNSL